jgi:hypothetical protein
MAESIYGRYAIVDAGALRDVATKMDDAAGTLSGALAVGAGRGSQERG